MGIVEVTETLTTLDESSRSAEGRGNRGQSCGGVTVEPDCRNTGRF